MAISPRLGLPLLSVGQSQKELTHNEALILLDLLVQASCSGGPGNVPPSNPQPGSIHICGAAPSGEWAGNPQAVAMWTASGWRFVAPFAGLKLVDQSTGQSWQYQNGQWSGGVVLASQVRINGEQVLGARRAPIPDASGGAVVDQEARAALGLVLSTLRAHGIIATQ